MYKGPTPQPVTLHRGPLGPPWELSWTTFILHLLRYLHTRHLDCYTSGSGEEDFWNLQCFVPWGPSPWAPMWATAILWTTLHPLPIRMIPTKFGWNRLTRSGEEDENVKVYGRRTTDDARRTTDDGRKPTAIAHLSLQLRWAKKTLQYQNWRTDWTVKICFFLEGFGNQH